ncbi:MAG: hypothetical protein R3Y45_03420 [Bacillota bacterium]
MDKIKCTACGVRLFDMHLTGKVVIEIKCPRCKTILKINKENKRILTVNTEQRHQYE